MLIAVSGQSSWISCLQMAILLNGFVQSAAVSKSSRSIRIKWRSVCVFGQSAAARSDRYGVALKGNRPVRVPDGLEIKTCRDRIAVDCHHPHAGLHLALIFSEVSRIFPVNDVRIAFLRSKDYREAQRNTTATTVKYSFGGERFVSLLTPGSDPLAK